MRNYINLPINSQIKLLGLSPYQFFAAIVFVSFGFLLPILLNAPFFIGVLSGVFCFFPIYIYGSRINKEYKKGNPDPVNSASRFRSVPRAMVDSYGIFSLLRDPVKKQT